MGYKETIKEWRDESREAVEELVEKYGELDEVAETTMTWHNNGPWKRTVAYKEPKQHNFPKQHTDIVEQFVNYMVPAEKMEELARYDGSITVYRTRGEISAMCHGEGANYLALNLADEIVRGMKSVKEARKAYTDNIEEKDAGNPGPYLKALMFRPPHNSETAFFDEKTI